MPHDPVATYDPGNLPDPLVPATYHANFDAFVNYIVGQLVPGFNLGLAYIDAALVGDTETLIDGLTELQETTDVYAAYSGTANAIELTTGRSLASLTTGQEIRFRASSANTGATTIDVDGIGAVDAKTINGLALPADYIRTDVDTVARFDGTDLILNRAIEVVQVGTSPNESYIERFEDGSMTQTRTLRLTQSSISVLDRTVTWNSQFSSTPFVVSALLNTISAAPGVTELAIITATSTSTEVTASLRRQDNETNFGGGDTADVTVVAKGFWFE